MSEQSAFGKSPEQQPQMGVSPGEINYHTVRTEVERLDAFLDAHALPLLDSEEEVRLALELRNGKAAQARREENSYATEADRIKDEQRIGRGERAEYKLIHANLRLVATEAKRYYRGHPLGRKYGLFDIFSAGMVGLKVTVHKFDPWRAAKMPGPKGEDPDPTARMKFSTPATWWIRHHITRELADKASTVHIPDGPYKQLKKLKNLETSRMDDLEICELMTITAEELLELRELEKNSGELVSLDKSVQSGDEGESPLGEFIADDRSGAEFANIDRQGALRSGNYLGLSHGASLIVSLLRPYITASDRSTLQKIALGQSLFDGDARRQRDLELFYKHPAIRAVIEVLRPTDVVKVEAWQDDAACEGEPELYSKTKPLTAEENRAVMRICGGCAVRAECQTFFEQNKPTRGRWVDGRSSAEFKPAKKQFKPATAAKK